MLIIIITSAVTLFAKIFNYRNNFAIKYDRMNNNGIKLLIWENINQPLNQLSNDQKSRRLWSFNNSLNPQTLN